MGSGKYLVQIPPVAAASLSKSWVTGQADQAVTSVALLCAVGNSSRLGRGEAT